jgi:Fic family protein
MQIVKKQIKGEEYYYLEHSYRFNAKIEKVQKYLGKEIPENIDKIKEDLMTSINKKLWYVDLDKIKKSFSKEFKSLPETAKKKYASNFMVKFTYNTNRIEGNTLTLKDTARLLEEGTTPKDKPHKDVKETEAHRRVFEKMMDEKSDLILNLVLAWHKDLFKDTDLEIAGKIRNNEVAISGSRFEPPKSIELDYLLRSFFQWYNNHKKNNHPVELAALVHLKFVTIHPFTDGNGRMSRLLMNFILHKNGFPLLDIQYINRNMYYTALERSQTKEDDRIFVRYLIKRYIKEYRKYI